jgi:hypothetical protein
MSDNKDWTETQTKLLADIEAFSRSKLDLSSVDVANKAKPAKGFPTLDADAAVAVPQEAAPKPQEAVSDPQPQPVAGGSLLEKLKREAQAKQMTESQHFSLQVQKQRFISDAMQSAYQYLREFCEQLNILKPAVPLSYNLLGLVNLEGMSWQEGRADFRLLPDASEDRLVEQVTLRYRLGSGQELRVERENPTHEAFRVALMEWNIPFKSEETRNAKNFTERTTFIFPCEVKAGFALAADYKIGDIRLLVRNIRRFGAAEYRLPHEALDHGTLEEMARLIMGEDSRFEKMFRRVA